MVQFFTATVKAFSIDASISIAGTTAHSSRALARAMINT